MITGKPPAYPPAPGDAPYLTAEQAATVTLGAKLRLRPTWPTAGNQGCGPGYVRVYAITNDPSSQTGRLFCVMDDQRRCAKLDAAWFQEEPWMDPFYEPPTK